MELSKLMADLAATEFDEKIKPNKKKSKRLLAAFDAETDPFKHGDIPAPFCWGIKIENGEYYKFWGDDCTRQFINFLKKYPHPLKLFAHNGGKFDFIFLLRSGVLSGEPTIINSRIVEVGILDGRHILRDSYAMIPVPLSAYAKDEIDYNKMLKEVRLDHKDEILKYLKSDCEYLLELVQKFIENYGDNITVGSAALKQLKALHPFDKINVESDAIIRPYYKGGRVQCFKDGIVRGKKKVFDVNSMYPSVMKHEMHATHEGAIYLNNNLDDAINHDTGQLVEFPECCYFATIEGKFLSEFGHFPVRTKAGLDFTQKEGVFEVTHHELICALKNKVFVLEKVHSIIVCPNSISFAEYVDKFIALKISAQKAGLVAETLFAKLMLNSAYGKFGQNPEKFKDYLIVEPWEVMEVEARNIELQNKILKANPAMAADDIPESYFWQEGETTDDYLIFERKPDDVSGAFNDCFVAASVTGAARAVLMDALIHADDPVYCDTDSVICKDLGANVERHPNNLGAWDLEAEGDAIYIYGKKVYALYKDGKPYVDKKGNEKTANKGVRMTAEQIKNLVTGENLSWSNDKNAMVFKWKNDAPSFKLSGETLFITRELIAKQQSKSVDVNSTI